MEHIIPCSNKQWFVFKLKGKFSIYHRLIILQKWKNWRCIRYGAIWWQRLCSGEVWCGHLRSNYVQQKWGAGTCTAILSRAKSTGRWLAKRGAVLGFVLSQRCFALMLYISTLNQVEKHSKRSEGFLLPSAGNVIVNNMLWCRHCLDSHYCFLRE